LNTTPQLIHELVRSAKPVRRLRPPLLRAALWISFAIVLLCVIAMAHGLRSDIGTRMRDPLFVSGMAGALMTGVLAAIASFRLSLPDSSRGWLLLPMPALTLWFSSIGYGCLTDWVSIGPNGVRMGEAIRCFATLLLTSVPLSAAMLVMLRYAAFLRPALVSAVSGLAVAAMTAFALSLFHDLEATAMVLIWNVGVALVIAGIASVAGRRMLTWMTMRLSSAERP
jgi:hypothetical protein